MSLVRLTPHHSHNTQLFLFYVNEDYIPFQVVFLDTIGLHQYISSKITIPILISVKDNEIVKIVQHDTSTLSVTSNITGDEVVKNLTDFFNTFIKPNVPSNSKNHISKLNSVDVNRDPNIPHLDLSTINVPIDLFNGKGELINSSAHALDSLYNREVQLESFGTICFGRKNPIICKRYNFVTVGFDSETYGKDCISEILYRELIYLGGFHISIPDVKDYEDLVKRHFKHSSLTKTVSTNSDNSAINIGIRALQMHNNTDLVSKIDYVNRKLEFSRKLYIHKETHKLITPTLCTSRVGYSDEYDDSDDESFFNTLSFGNVNIHHEYVCVENVLFSIKEDLYRVIETKDIIEGHGCKLGTNDKDTEDYKYRLIIEQLYPEWYKWVFFKGDLPTKN